MYTKILLILLACSFLVLTGCMKDFLNEKRDRSQVIPSTLEDLESILLHQNMNSFSVHQLAEIGSDDYFVGDAQWQAMSNPVAKNGYIWADEIFENTSSQDWNRGYEKILYANFVLEELDKINRQSNSRLADVDRVMGMAYFHRGLNYFNLAQLFMEQYSEEEASQSLGLPIRTTSNINVNVGRSNMKDTYSQIEEDLKKSISYLPASAQFKTIPTITAAYAMMAILKLQQEEYRQAKLYADSAIYSSPRVLDYNSIEYGATTPFTNYGLDNQEVIFISYVATPVSLSSSRMNVDTVLLRSYRDNDLRKLAFFRLNGERTIFKGSYAGTNALIFTGITSAELLLIRAECSARLNDHQQALSDIQSLMKNRYIESTELPAVPSETSEELLSFILDERRKELVFRGRRWQDLKRYSRHSDRNVSLKRNINGVTYELIPGSPKWVWPIPPDVIQISGVEQNRR